MNPIRMFLVHILEKFSKEILYFFLKNIVFFLFRRKSGFYGSLFLPRNKKIKVIKTD